ncbi:Asp/Glu racemase [Mycena polygramma]|nr:Asp/Glu racemase [Mycena polygramma]KAJ7620840.1 Asp/Glu racemase [Mycena polygramma]
MDEITIHLISPVTTEGIRDLGEIAHLTGPSLKITHSLLGQGPKSIECAVDEAYATPGILKRAVEAQEARADAVIIDCMCDPGLHASRELLEIPVFGPGETSMHSAAMLGQKFSIITVLKSVGILLERNARIYGVSEKIASVRVVDIPVLELGQRLDDVKDRLAEEALKAVEQDGAHAIVLGCTGFLGCANAIKRRLEVQGHRGVPVIDPIPHTVCIAEAFVKSGLSHSKITYEKPCAERFQVNKEGLV